MKPIRPTPPPGYITHEAAAACLNTSRSTISYYIKARVLLSVKIGKYAFVSKEEIMAVAGGKNSGKARQVSDSFATILAAVKSGESIDFACLSVGITRCDFYRLATPKQRHEVSSERAAQRSERAFSGIGKGLINYGGILFNEDFDYYP